MNQIENNTVQPEVAVFSMQGRLIEKGRVRFVGDKGSWRVCSFALAYVSGNKEQMPIFEAVRSAIDQLQMIKEGRFVTITGQIKGKIRNADAEHIGKKYSNILEVHTIEECRKTSNQ